MIYLLTAIGLTPVAIVYRVYRTHLQTNNTKNNTINNFGWKAFRDSSPEWSN